MLGKCSINVGIFFKMFLNLHQNRECFSRFFPKDDNLGELMSNVCVACVRGWAGVGACSAEGVGDGLDPAGGRLGHHSRSSAPDRGAMPA